METTVSLKLPEVLLDKSIEFHTRKGLRDWCDCEYCTAKRNGTSSIAHIGTWLHYGTYGLRRPWVSDYDNWEIWSAIVQRRKVEAKKLRQKLNELKLEL